MAGYQLLVGLSEIDNINRITNNIVIAPPILTIKQTGKALGTFYKIVYNLMQFTIIEIPPGEVEK